MQVFVRSLSGATCAVQVHETCSVADIKEMLEERGCPPAQLQLLSHQGRLLQEEHRSLGSWGISSGSTLHMSTRLQGGAPVLVKLLTNHLPCGQQVQIDIDSSTPKLLVMQKIFEASGLPVEHQKLMLSGINQIVVGDKRTNIKFDHCGTASSLYFAINNPPAAAGAGDTGSSS